MITVSFENQSKRSRETSVLIARPLPLDAATQEGDNKTKRSAQMCHLTVLLVLFTSKVFPRHALRNSDRAASVSHSYAR